MASKDKPRRDSSERWLLTRKTWRYMADAGRRLIPEGWSPDVGATGYQLLENEFQNVCKKEKSFLLWPRKKRTPDAAAEEAEEEPASSSCFSETQTTLGGADSSLTCSDDDITVIEDQAYLAGPGRSMFELQDGAYGASSEAYSRPAGSRVFSSGSRVVPVGFDAAAAEELKERLRQRQYENRQEQLERDEVMVTIGELQELEQDGVKKLMRHVGIQTDSRLQEPVLPLPPVETDSGKGTEAEVSTPDTPLSPLSVVDCRAETLRSPPTSVTSGTSSGGTLAHTTLKSPPTEIPKDMGKKDPPEQPSPVLDRFGDKLSRYMKMARRDSATRDKDKKDRFKTVNYDKSLRNIKSKRINAETLEDMSEDILPLDLDDPPKPLLSLDTRSKAKKVPRPAAAPAGILAKTHTVEPQRPADTKKRKRRGIQVGEPLPQYILDSLRGAFVGFKSVRKMSKAESELSHSADDKSLEPLSPRYSITVSDELGTRDLTLSDVESSTAPPFSLYSSARTSLDVTADGAADDLVVGGRAGAAPDAAAAPPCQTAVGHEAVGPFSAHPPKSAAAPVQAVIVDCAQPQRASTPSPSRPGIFGRRKSSTKPPPGQPAPISPPTHFHQQHPLTQQQLQQLTQQQLQQLTQQQLQQLTQQQLQQLTQQQLQQLAHQQTQLPQTQQHGLLAQQQRQQHLQQQHALQQQPQQQHPVQYQQQLSQPPLNTEQHPQQYQQLSPQHPNLQQQQPHITPQHPPLLQQPVAQIHHHPPPHTPPQHSHPLQQLAVQAQHPQQPHITPQQPHPLQQPAAQAHHQQQPPGAKKGGFLSTVMQKSQKVAGGGGNHGSRVVAKKLWKSRSKSQSRTSLSSACVWTPQGSCQWVNIQNRAVSLTDTSLLHLTEVETAALQQVALQRLAEVNLGCTVRIPKNFTVTPGHKTKRRAYLLKKRPLTTGFFDTAKRDDKDGGVSQGLVFGIPLQKCMENERRLRQRASTPTLRERLQEPAAAAALHTTAAAAAAAGGRHASHGGSHASFTSLIDAIRDKTSGSCESLNLADKRSSVQDSSLSLTSDGAADMALQPHIPQVPMVLSACIRHIETYGLQTVGVFRVSSSKKRARQLREEFDSGIEVHLTEDLCPHDVATLIKEFFRDLPEPLLPHDLYQPFIATQKIRNRRHQFECLQYLIQLLALPNRDTLWALLCFLKKVADNAADRRSNTGDWLTGNKMDSNNLATLFAPNMLHALTAVTPGAVDLAQQTAERIDVINVVRSLIDHNSQLFQVSAEMLHDAYQVLMDRHPEALDVLLRRRLHGAGAEDADLDLDTSSSVFEGSECSSAPTSLADRERCRDGADERRGCTREAQQDHQYSAGGGAHAAAPERSRRFRRRQEAGSRRERSRRRDKSGDKSGSKEDLAGAGGWFRRRVRSSSSTRPPSEEAAAGGDERPVSRWFRRRDKSHSQASDSGSDASQQQQGRRGSLQTADRPLLMRAEVRQRSTSDQMVGGGAQPAPAPRRLSSPELDVAGVITASLTIPVPTAARAAAAGAGLHDIPYIEECQTVSGMGSDDVFVVRTGDAGDARRRDSSDSESIGSTEPITGSLSIQPVRRSRSGLVGDQGLVVSASGGARLTAPEPQISRSASAGVVAPPAPVRRSRPRPAEHVTHAQLLLPAAAAHAQVIRSRTSPNVREQATTGTAAAAAAAPAPPRRRHISHSGSPETLAEGGVRRREEATTPARRTRRTAGRSVTANVLELQRAEAVEPAVWKRRQLIASDAQSGV